MSLDDALSQPNAFLANNPSIKRLIDNFASEITPAKSDSYCACCKKTVKDCYPHGRGVVTNVYSKTVWHCVSCHTLFHGSLDLLGLEGRKVVPQKLGMSPGCGLFVTNDQCVLIAGGKYYDKFKSAGHSIFTDILQLGGATLTLKLMELWRDNGDKPSLVINDLGRKKAELVANLRMSSKHKLNLVSPDTILSLGKNEDLFIQHMLSIEAKPRKELLTLLGSSCRDNMAAESAFKMQALAQQNGLEVPLSKLTQDPHVRLAALQIVKGASK